MKTTVRQCKKEIIAWFPATLVATCQALYIGTFCKRHFFFFATDFLISCLIFWVFLFQEVRKHHIKHWWIYIFATLTVGLSFAFPLFLYFRQKTIDGKGNYRYS
ncbi:DUF2834 domain-containing protein [Brevibacillus sp. MER 51]|uniref:DUF2834 domain-containing protein n=1 Tax=Brevibacillus sp. MER 51 TaxID=2939560 RepID=UPI0020404EEC|nr:DUF2834 domain-containing protein [Brevibacillus sp. MER 51]MCM3141630.1 DUF2834 domain-containing protein [Brevibacillus sp. MER 51]